jgi:DNA-binding FadR family transcriptional regulator
MPPRPALERRKVTEQIADALRADIVGGKLKVGASLPSERDLAQQYDVNRSSVREALLRLEAWGLVEIRQGGATRVRDYLDSGGMNVLPHLIELGQNLDPGILSDLHGIRGMLLGWCAERAAERADASSIGRLDALVTRMSEPNVRARELQELDYDFFEELVNITGNRVLALLSNLVRDIYLRGRDRFSALYQPGVFDPAHHARAVQAIRDRSPAAAGVAMRAHAATALTTVEPSV